MDADARARLRETVLQDATRPWSAFTVIDLLDHIGQLEAQVRRVRELHALDYYETACEHPRKGCEREDCHLVQNTMWGSNRYLHEKGHAICSHCTETGDPYCVVSDEWPCPTIRALDSTE